MRAELVCASANKIMFQTTLVKIYLPVQWYKRLDQPHLIQCDLINQPFLSHVVVQAIVVVHLYHLVFFIWSDVQLLAGAMMQVSKICLRDSARRTASKAKSRQVLHGPLLPCIVTCCVTFRYQCIIIIHNNFT